MAECNPACGSIDAVWSEGVLQDGLGVGAEHELPVQEQGVPRVRVRIRVRVRVARASSPEQGVPL